MNTVSPLSKLSVYTRGVLILATTLFFSLAVRADSLSGDVLIINANVVEVESMTLKPEMNVLIEGGRIKKIGKLEGVKAETVIDAQRAFLVPGLIDSHTHLGGIPGMDYQQMQANPELVSEAGAQIPRAYLYHGFTTVVDLHGDAERMKSWNSLALRPQAYFCGGAPLMDGYPMSFQPKPHRYTYTPYFLLGDNEAPVNINADQHTPAAVINRMKEDGAICVKTHYETGFGGSRNLPTPSKELIQELATQAETHGMKLLLHASSQSAQSFGVDAGVNAFVHGMWKWNDSMAQALTPQIKVTIDAAVKKDIALQPTLQVLFGERDLHDPSYLTQDRLAEVVPESMIEWYQSESGQSFRNRMASLPFVSEFLESGQWQKIDAEPIMRASLATQYWVKQGGRLLFGSDTPSDLTYANPAGLNGRMEMRNWQQLGITPQQFLAAATINNAEFFGLEREIGSVEEGKRADLLLLSNNPLDSISAFDSIKMIFIQGKSVSRDSLQANQ